MGKGRWDGEVIFNIKPSILIFLKIKRTASLPSLFFVKAGMFVYVHVH